MGDEKKCLRCGGSNVVSSELQSTGKVYARPKDAKLVTIFTTGVLVGANVCFDCGYVDLLVDADKVKSIMWRSSWNPPTGIDSHRWESKVEFYGGLKSKRP